jgi:hypothetical protein
MNKSTLFLFAFYFFLSGRVWSQSPDSAIRAYSSHFEEEKIHLHLDKDAYLPGETIWIKAYILSGGKPSHRSSNLYFDWTDAGGNLIWHSVSPVSTSTATSSFVVPAAFNGGALHLRAYTAWMLNFDSDFLYNRDIPVLSRWDGSNPEEEKPSCSIRFFPEGGDLVSGLSSMVSFEATDQHGTPVNVRGTVKNSNNEIVDSFVTVHEGMGSFRVRPSGSERYSAYWTDEYGDSHITKLPQPLASGIVLRVNPSLEKIYFQIERLSECTENLKTLSIRAIAHQKLAYSSSLDLKSQNLADGTISTEKLPDGVVQLTVFDAEGQPLAERIVFVDNHQFEFSTQITNDLVNFAKKGRNEFSIEVPDSMSTDLSVSVTDGSLAYDSSNSILADFLLSSDIRGIVRDPSYYLTNSTESWYRNNQLDLVMRTHGWRRFKWEEVLAGKAPVIRYPAQGDAMALGGVVGTTGSTVNKSDSIAVLMITRDHKKHLFQLPLAPDGSFVQKGVSFYDTVQVLYRLNHPDKFGGPASVSFRTGLLTSAGSPSPVSHADFPWLRIPDLILEKESDGQLTELNSYARQAAMAEYAISMEHKDSLRTNAETALHYLQANFPDLKFPQNAPAPGGSETRYAVYSVNPAAATTPAKPTVNVLLDGLEAGKDDLSQISMKDVLFIKFLDKTAASKGLPTLSLSTRQSVAQDNVINHKTGFAVIKGYSPAKEFYGPEYTGSPEEDQVSDLRTTLYWNPNIKLDPGHRKIKFAFYNNDQSNKFRIVVEGINQDGRLTRMVEQIMK